MNLRGNRKRAADFADRRTREDGAARLHELVPRLVSLRLDIEDRASVVGSIRYTRRVAVARAPALFLVPCTDRRCVGEQHDLTAAIMAGLSTEGTSFRGEDACKGSVEAHPCSRVIHFDAVAEYGTVTHPAAAA